MAIIREASHRKQKSDRFIMSFVMAIALGHFSIRRPVPKDLIR